MLRVWTDLLDETHYYTPLYENLSGWNQYVLILWTENVSFRCEDLPLPREMTSVWESVWVEPVLVL